MVTDRRNDEFTDDARAAGPAVAAVLEGGPADLPAADRSRAVPAGADKIKLRWQGGYEHFVRHDSGAGGPVVFRWAMRTRVAE
ncbi:DUF5988 family protein [Virgisporangium aurantiacum]|uniref:Uncharacterized protein n=1 Tax=Virgisporangium aurantiacum TaxID=175570 RepID=A0A8J3ZFK1_9ACTN|nr:DUF5988 family protein [Virgisporangium aurantiacum]GIJ60428.1 hypothetical protein Vau01_079440 [Virgisporangium aurantiacum]